MFIIQATGYRVSLHQTPGSTPGHNLKNVGSILTKSSTAQSGQSLASFVAGTGLLNFSKQSSRKNLEVNVVKLFLFVTNAPGSYSQYFTFFITSK
jgi:hypothetical protein